MHMEFLMLRVKPNHMDLEASADQKTSLLTKQRYILKSGNPKKMYYYEKNISFLSQNRKANDFVAGLKKTLRLDVAASARCANSS